jgi:hypothetical protein
MFTFQGSANLGAKAKLWLHRKSIDDISGTTCSIENKRPNPYNNRY